MKKEISSTQAKHLIDNFFKQTSFSQKDLKKIKRLAMKYKIKLGKLKSNYCKHCLSQLEGRVNINKKYKTITCKICQSKNKIYFKSKIKLS